MSFFDRFKILPKKDPGSPTPSAAASPVQAAIERRNRKRKNARHGAIALIIDDSPTVVAVLRKILRSAGYITRDAGDAESGLAMLAEAKPDVIFLDIVLPGMNGFGALRVIRKDPATHHIPVIMISGNEHATEQFYANKIGADDFMKKPFSRFEVFARIEMLLDANRNLQRKGFAADPAPTAPSLPAASTLAHGPEMEARQQLTAMGLQYFDQGQFFAAIRRSDQLAVALFIAGRGVTKDTSLEGKTALAVAVEIGRPEIIQAMG